MPARRKVKPPTKPTRPVRRADPPKTDAPNVLDNVDASPRTRSDDVKQVIIPDGANIDPRKWNHKDVVAFLKANQEEYDITRRTIQVIKAVKVSGRTFLQLTVEMLLKSPYSLRIPEPASLDYLIRALSKGKFSPPMVKSYAETEAVVEDIHPRQIRISILRAILNEYKEGKSQKLSHTKYTITMTESDFLWRAIKPVYQPIIKKMVIKQKDIPEDIIESLHKNILIARRGFGGIFSSSDAMRLHYIMQVIMHLITLFDRETSEKDLKVVKIEAQNPIPGSTLNIRGQFEFIIQRGMKKIYLVQAKNNDMLQGML